MLNEIYTPSNGVRYRHMVYPKRTGGGGYQKCDGTGVAPDRYGAGV